MSLSLSKNVPARTKTITADWLKKDWMPMSPAYRAARSRLRKPMDTCFWCSHKFEDGEMMAIASLRKSGNKLFCQTCADAFQ